MKEKKILVGGAFSIIHPGHIFFLKEVKKFGNVIVVIARDENLKKRRKKILMNENERKKIVKEIKFVDKVLLGDKINYFKVIKKEKPDIIALGYDQKIEIKKIKKFFPKIKIIRIKSKNKKNWKTTKIVEKILRRYGNKTLL